MFPARLGMDRTMRKANMIFNGLLEEVGLGLRAQVQSALRGVDCTAANKVVDAVRFGPACAAAGAGPTRVPPVRVAFSAPEGALAALTLRYGSSL